MNDPQQISLFDEHSNQGSRLVAIVAPRAKLTKGQQTFNRLVEKIRQQRELLAEWQAFTLRCQQRVASELEPLRRELCEGQRQMCRLLDELLTAPPKGLGRRQRGKLVIMLEGVAQAVLVHGPDEEIEALHDKHARSTLEESQRAELKMTEAFVSAFLGEDMVKGHGAGSAEELFQHAQEKMHASAAGRAEANAQRAQARAARRGERPAKADLAQQRREQAAKEASQSVREIYRKLVSALHPDRVTDPGERARRTELMQRVNLAYEKRQLLDLLSIQIEIEQIDTSNLANVSGERIGHYNQVLREQLAELEAEVAATTAPYRAMLELQPWQTKFEPALVDASLTREIQQIKAILNELRADLVALRDPARLRDFLKHVEFDDGAGDSGDIEDLALLLGAIDDSGRAGRRRRRRR